MPAGIQVFNSDASMQFDSSHHLGRFVMSFSTGTGDGSVALPAGLTGQVVPLISSAALGRATPGLSVSGGRVHWTFGAIPSVYRANSSVIVVVL